MSFNTFGKTFRFTSWGESHGPAIGCVIDGCPPLIPLKEADIQNESKESPAYKKYFMHGTSHHLGLDTHDYGLLENPMQENMVFTVEPGIYLPDEGFGVRIEDDVVIQAKGDPLNLMQDIPIEIEEIEELMNN